MESRSNPNGIAILLPQAHLGIVRQRVELRPPRHERLQGAQRLKRWQLPRRRRHRVALAAAATAPAPAAPAATALAAATASIAGWAAAVIRGGGARGGAAALLDGFVLCGTRVVVGVGDALGGGGVRTALRQRLVRAGPGPSGQPTLGEQ